ncbi:MAG: cupin domain-containing protein [Chlamydiae bacterium]|nr:cupin domain-containing protein [Chlamydiota bacterium]
MFSSFLPLLGAVIATVIDEHLTIYPLVPTEANQGWNLELFDCSRVIPLHYHKIQRQFILVVDGSMDAVHGNEKTILRRGEILQIEPGVEHALVPEKKCRFFAIDLPGFHFPEDVFEDHPDQLFSWKGIDFSIPPLDEKYFQEKIEQTGYIVYGLISGEITENQWSVALLEIHDSPKHYHLIETEQFLVVNGVLDIEIDGVHKEMSAGESIAIHPRTVHQLKSARKEPVRVLCFNFPAFSLHDFYPID